MATTTQRKTVDIAPRPHRWLRQSHKARFNVLYGGASSAKSWTVAFYIALEKFWRLSGTGTLVVRKTHPSVRMSCWRLMLHWLAELDFLRHCRVNQTSSIVTGPNGSFMQFVGLDDVEKLKSVEGINYVWVEEANEITEHDLWQLHIRCRHRNPHENNCIFMTFNPIDPVGNAWLKRMTDMAPEGEYLRRPLRVLMVTYKDNRFLSAEERATIEGLADSDAEYDAIYRRGQWATPTAIIYTNWDVIPEFPTLDRLDEVGYGLDFGYVHPTALIRVGVRGDDVYLQEMLYERGLTNPQLIERLPGLIHDRMAMIWADSAQPAYIDEIYERDWNVHGVEKAQGQGNESFVQTGIDRVKRKRLHVTADSANLIAELEGYKWATDKQGNVLPRPVKFKDDAMDAVRYYLGSLPQESVTEVLQMPEWLREQLLGSL